MHGLGELLAFCLEFKKFFRLPLPRLVPVASRDPLSRRATPPSSLRISFVSLRARLRAAPYARFRPVNIRGEKYKGDAGNGRKATPAPLVFLSREFAERVYILWEKKNFAAEDAIVRAKPDPRAVKCTYF